MINIKENYNLKTHNTFGMDAECRLWIEYTTPEDLTLIFTHTYPLPYKSIGEGSNLLFRQNYTGTLLYNKITEIDIQNAKDGYVTVRVGGGVKMDDLVKITIEEGLWGIENLSGIPGTVGAAAVQNIGAYGVEFSDVVESVEVFDTHDATLKTIAKDQCDYSYRKSRFKSTDKDRYAVTYVNIRLSLFPTPRLDYANLKTTVGHPNDQEEIRKAIIALRDSKLPDPRLYGNAGSFFMNPIVSAEKYRELCETYAGEEVPKYDAPNGIKVPAAWLIDKAGWRGQKNGGAAVWSKQPLVIVNYDGTATAQDIINLKDAIIQDINNKFGIILTPEAEIL